MSDTPYTAIPLTTNWTFKQGNLKSTSVYLPANDLPTEIFRDLLKNEKIADPYVDLNELSVRWVADETWTYRTTFKTPSNHGTPGVKTVLEFEGLDTFASVYLNRKLILDSENMFLKHRVSVSSHLVNSTIRENILEIVFESARKRGLELVGKHPEHKFIVHQTEVSRGPVRKAQYHWGWDWGPILISCGPWKPIVLSTYHSRIEDVRIDYELSNDLKRAKGKLSGKVEGSDAEWLIKIKKNDAGDGEDIMQFKGETANGVFGVDFDMPVDLWWPQGYGSQTLYHITATLSSSMITLHEVTKMVGFRKTELIQDKDSFGTSFYLRINDIDIFIGGSCWIPTDSFLTQVTTENYYDWIKLAAEGNQTMVRVWGGGIYEYDAFYQTCDELGVLVWQDFMFACANYPAYPEYLKSVEDEARQNVRRIRHHPSIVIWAGNNEDYQIVERYGLEYRFEDDKNPESWLKTDFPARYLYEYLLPKIVKEEITGVPYHPSSPFGNGTSTTLKVDQTVGDIHQWNVWHGEMKPYQLLGELGGRFVSEFGMEAYPHLETLQRSISREDDRCPGSMAMDFRNKAIGHERRLGSYVAENFRIKHDLPSFTHLTQVMQADTMAWAYKSWRRQWGTKGQRQCGGVLVWQLNDCWPTMSWAVVDYYLVPKPAYYAIKRAMQPTVIAVTRKFYDWTVKPADDLWKKDTGHIDMRKILEEAEYDIWITTNYCKQRWGQVDVRCISINTGKDVHEVVTQNVLIEPNGTTEAIKGQRVQVPHPQDAKTPYDISKADPFIVHTILTIDGQEVASDVSWPDPIKYLNFSHRGVDVQYSEDGSTALVSASKPVKGFVFGEKQGVRLDDNGFDLVPGYDKEVKIIGARADSLEWTFVGM